MLCETVPAQRWSRLEVQKIHFPEFYTAQSWAVPRSVETHADDGCLLQISRSGILLLFSSTFFVSRRDATLVLQWKNSTPGTQSPELFLLVGSRRTFFFFVPKLFFSPCRVAFGVFMLRLTSKTITVAIRSNMYQAFFRFWLCSGSTYFISYCTIA